MFRGSIVWKGIVYSLLMAVAKGLVSLVVYYEYFSKILRTRNEPVSAHRDQEISLQSTPKSHPGTSPVANPQAAECMEARRHPSHPPHAIASLVGFSMIARGEIGFLIASLSQSSGTLVLKNPDGADVRGSGEEIFLVIVWAVVSCTIAGPVGVGITVRMLRRHDSTLYPGWL